MSTRSETLRATLEANPADWSVRHALVAELQDAGDDAAAVAVLSSVTSLPDDEAGLLWAAKTYRLVGANGVDRLVDAVIARNPFNEEALALREALKAAPAAKAQAEDKPTDGEAGPGENLPVGKAMAVAGDIVGFDHLIEEMEAAMERRVRNARRRDQINAVLVTVAIHVGALLALGMVVKTIPRDAPPQIVAQASEREKDVTIDPNVLKKPNPRQPAATDMALPDILSVAATSSVSLSNVEATPSPAADFGVEFMPSVSFGAMTSSTSMMMFGQKMDMKGEVLGVILDVSGSMAEWLPDVIREVDKNFKNAPIVYVRNALMQKGSASEILPVVAEEVLPHYPDDPRRQSPYWFLWHDLPRKAPQRYVDRLIQSFKTRPNCFLVVGGHNRITAAAEFLADQKVDALYVFSDFEDYVDEELTQTLGATLGRRNLPTYLQPAVAQTDSLSIMTKDVAKRSSGRQFPPLVTLLGGQEARPTVAQKSKATMPNPEWVTYATPREEKAGKLFFEDRAPAKSVEIGRLSEPEYDAVFYGPEARVEIFLKNAQGKYIQRPIIFSYHSWKWVEDNKANRSRRRDFLRVSEEPKFDGKEIVWKMVLEDEVKFDVYLYVNPKGMNATYVADIPEDTRGDSAFISFRVPPLIQERQDSYFGYDYPAAGLTLEQARDVTRPNMAMFNLPSQERERFGRSWEVLGFQPGQNDLDFATMVRNLPGGIRELEVKGPSFGPRIVQARTTSSKVLLEGWNGRADFELWEGFHCTLRRPNDSREKFTKTEAIAIDIK